MKITDKSGLTVIKIYHMYVKAAILWYLTTNIYKKVTSLKKVNRKWNDN